MDSKVREYMASIGSKGGQRSRRRLDANTARDMVRLREARRAFVRFYESCFWSCDPDYLIRLEDIPWLAQQLMTYGGRAGWELGAKLCR